MRSIVTAVLAAGAIAAAAGTADARPADCDSRAKILERLDADHERQPAPFGKAANGSLVEILSTDDGATWTFVITHGDGTTCLLAASELREALPQVAVEPEG